MTEMIVHIFSRSQQPTYDVLVYMFWVVYFLNAAPVFSVVFSPVFLVSYCTPTVDFKSLSSFKKTISNISLTELIGPS